MFKNEKLFFIFCFVAYICSFLLFLRDSASKTPGSLNISANESAGNFSGLVVIAGCTLAIVLVLAGTNHYIRLKKTNKKIKFNKTQTIRIRKLKDGSTLKKGN